MGRGNNLPGIYLVVAFLLLSASIVLSKTAAFSCAQSRAKVVIYALIEYKRAFLLDFLFWKGLVSDASSRFVSAMQTQI